MSLFVHVPSANGRGIAARAWPLLFVLSQVVLQIFSAFKGALPVSTTISRGEDRQLFMNPSMALESSQRDEKV